MNGSGCPQADVPTVKAMTELFLKSATRKLRVSNTRAVSGSMDSEGPTLLASTGPSVETNLDERKAPMMCHRTHVVNAPAKAVEP